MVITMRLSFRHHHRSPQYFDGNCRGTEAIVNVYDTHTRRAAAETREQSGNAVPTDAVADTRWDRDNRCINETCNDARQTSIHTCDNEDDVTFAN